MKSCALTVLIPEYQHVDPMRVDSRGLLRLISLDTTKDSTP